MLDDKGQLFIGYENGFQVKISKVLYYNYALPKNDILKFVKQGPED